MKRTVTSGNTYYEKYFKAVLKYNDIREEYERRKMFLRHPSKLATKDFFTKFRIPENQVSFVKKCYDKTKTYLEFFKDLKKYCKSNNMFFCEIIYSWQDSFLEYILGSPNEYWMSTWIIDKSNIKMIELYEWNNANINVEEVDFILQEEFKKSQTGGYVSGSFVLGDLE